MSPEAKRTDGGETCYQRGARIQTKVAGLIERHDKVVAVRETEKGGIDDRNGRDLIVTVQDDEHGGTMNIYVQVKSSRGGVRYFIRFLQKMLHLTGNGRREQVEKWMTDEGMILINGDLEESRSGKHARHRTDLEILEDFKGQLGEIVHNRGRGG